MVIRTGSFVYRLVCALPMSMPIGVEQCRVGSDTVSYCRVFFRR
jgi:hypothetical protein